MEQLCLAASHHFSSSKEVGCFGFVFFFFFPPPPFFLSFKIRSKFSTLAFIFFFCFGFFFLICHYVSLRNLFKKKFKGRNKASKETDVSHIKYAINLVPQILCSELSDRNCQISTLIQV